jgi:hypothetical protein
LLGLAVAGLLAVRHAFRTPLRFLLVIHLTGCLLLAALVPIKASRYVVFQVPLVILLASAAFVALARALTATARPATAPTCWRAYAAAVGTLPVLLLLVLGTGLTFQLTDLPGPRAHTYRADVYNFPAVDQATAYLARNWREGDVVLATTPQQVLYETKRPPWPGIYLVSSFLSGTVEFPDHSDVLLDSRSGAGVIHGLDELKDLFARHDRIWFVAVPGMLARNNTSTVASYIQDQMEIVYEDRVAVVMLWGNRHWPAESVQRGAHSRADFEQPANEAFAGVR